MREKDYMSGNRASLDVLSVLRDVGRMWQVILLVGLASAMLCYSMIALFHTPMYTVSQIFAVNQKSASANATTDISATYEMSQKFSTILENNILRKKVAEDLGVASVSAQMQAQVVPETNMMQLSVTATSPREAFVVLESMLRTYPTISEYVLPDVVLNTMQQPEISSTPSNLLPVGKYMAYTFLVAAAAVIAVVALLSYWRDTVKNEEEFTQKVDGDLLGTIYHEKKSKKDISMLILNPLLSFKYVEAYRMLAARVKSRMDKREAKVLMVTSVTENEGKSTVASNLALSLAHEQKKVLLIDCDFRKPALYKIFTSKVEKQTDLTEVLMGKVSTEGVIKKVPNTQLYLTLSYHSTENFTELLSNGRLKTLLDYCRKQMDYIILDTPPMGLVADSEDVAAIADAALLVVRQDMVLARDINDVLDILDQDAGKVIGCVYSNVRMGLSERMNTSQYGYGNYNNYSKADR